MIQLFQIEWKQIVCGGGNFEGFFHSLRIHKTIIIVRLMEPNKTNKKINEYFVTKNSA